VWLRTKATEIDAGHVATDEGRALDAATVIWATGVRAPGAVSGLSAEHGKHGRIIVNDCLQVAGHPNVFAIGDNAEVQGRPVPLLAAAAMQQGKSAASSIVRLLLDRQPEPFAYHDLGSVVSVGHRAGVADVAGHVVGGFAGWLAWRVVHLARITSFRNKIATALDWTTGYFYDVDTARLDVDPRSRAA
jgi:NADH dehydrogenase